MDTSCMFIVALYTLSMVAVFTANSTRTQCAKLVEVQLYAPNVEWVCQ